MNNLPLLLAALLGLSRVTGGSDSLADPLEPAYLEYEAHLLVAAENWPALYKIYTKLKDKDPRVAAKLLGVVENEKIRSLLEKGDPKAFKPGALEGVWKLLPVGKLPEWPPVELRGDLFIAERLREKRQWETLQTFMLEKFTTNPNNWNYMQPLRQMVSSFLALLDYSSDRHPNCIAPWPPSAVLSVKKKARILTRIFRLRTGKLTISTPSHACKDIGETDPNLCARSLVAGNYGRADEALLVKDDDLLTQLGACYYLKTRGSKESRKFIETRPRAQDPAVRHFLSAFAASMAPAGDHWHHISKRLGTICPTVDYELPIYRRLRRFDGVEHRVRVEVKNREKLFWVLLAAQYKDMAQEQLRKVQKLLEESKMEILRTTWEKMQEVLTTMEQRLVDSKTVALSHLSGPHQPLIYSALEGLAEGDIRPANRAKEQLSQELARREEGSSYGEHQNVIKFFELLVSAFRNPQTLGPEQSLFHAHDWLLNWYVAQAVDQYSHDQDYVLLVDESVAEDKFLQNQTLLLFYAGRFQDALEFAAHHGLRLPKTLDERLRVCNLRREDICGPSVSPDAELIGNLNKVDPAKLCESIYAARTTPAVRDAVFRLSRQGRRMIDQTVTTETYLLPPLPGERRRRRHISSIIMMRVWDTKDLALQLQQPGDDQRPPVRVPFPADSYYDAIREAIQQKMKQQMRKRKRDDSGREVLSSASEDSSLSESEEEEEEEELLAIKDSASIITVENLVQTMQALDCWLQASQEGGRELRPGKRLTKWVAALQRPIAILPEVLELERPEPEQKALEQVLLQLSAQTSRKRRPVPLDDDAITRTRQIIGAAVDKLTSGQIDGE